MDRAMSAKEMRFMEKVRMAQEESNRIKSKRIQLKKLLFTDEEINLTCNLIENGYKLTAQGVRGTGLGAEKVEKLKYLYDIATDKKTISSKDDLCKHLRKMFGKHRKIGINDLALSKVSKVPRKALIGGIKNETFGIYNSSRYQGKDKMYDVIDVSGRRVTIKTDRKPIIKKGESKKLEGVIEIKELLSDKKVIISVDKNYIRMCNRFIIVASLRRPEYHHGLVEIICKEGTKVYVYAITMTQGEKPNYKGGSQRVYTYGFFKKDIKSKLFSVASAMYRYVNGVYKSVEPPNSDFTSINAEKTNEELYTDDVDNLV